MPERIHLAVALEGAGRHPAAWREPSARPRALTSPAYWRELARAADDAGLVLASIDDALSLGGRSTERDAEARRDRVRGRLDAVLLASFLAPSTRRIGLVPTVTTTHPEPFHLATGLQTLDHASLGRAGVLVVAGSTPQERANFGRRADGPGSPTGGAGDAAVDDRADAGARAAALREAGEVIDAIRRLADSWEDDAIVRDVATGRFLDRERVHDVGIEGEFFSIAGASIVPRSPQGQPLVAVGAPSPVPYGFAAQHADVVFAAPADARAVPAIVAELARAAAETRTGPDPLRVFADLVVLVEDTAAAARETWTRLEERASLDTGARVVVGTPDDVVDELRALAEAGVDGVRLHPARLPADLDAVAARVVPRAAAAGILLPDDGSATLRERLGLPRRASLHARQAAAA